MTWVELKTMVGVGGIFIAETMGKAMGGWDMWLKALVIFVVLDYVSGVLAAGVKKELSSEVGFKGIIKKVFIFILVAVAFEIDTLIGSSIIRIAVIGFYLGTEGLSILENAGRIGLPLPEVLKEALVQMRNRGEEGVTSANSGSRA